jgi:hypothetical protein
LSRESSDVPTSTARIMNLRDKVVEQGELESQSTINGKCEIDHHENKIIFLAPEGELVKKGQVVAKFDSSQFEEYVAERQTRLTCKLNHEPSQPILQVPPISGNMGGSRSVIHPPICAVMGGSVWGGVVDQTYGPAGVACVFGWTHGTRVGFGEERYSSTEYFWHHHQVKGVDCATD